MYSQGGQVMYQHAEPKGFSSEHIYLAGSLVASREWTWATSTLSTKYQHTDALGSPIAMSNEAGTVIERTNYDPYGGPIGKVVDGIGYTGHVMDGLTGLTNMQQRYYDQGVGRFLSVDPVAADETSGEGFNRYAYVGNNPYSYVDPDGRLKKLVLILVRKALSKSAPKKPPNKSPDSAPKQSPDVQPQGQQRPQSQQQRPHQPREELKASDKKLGEKFGEHRDDTRPGYRDPKEYRERAEELLNSRSAERVQFPSDAPKYPGETHIREGGDLLRLDSRGEFRSMYPDP
jgi:RHS repeat-associated protein